MIRTTEKRPLPAAALLLSALLLPALAARTMAAPRPEGSRLFAAVSAGYFHPLSGDVRAIYDRPAWPLELQLGWRVQPRLDLYAAARFLQLKGKTILGAAQESAESYSVRLQLLALRLGAGFCAGNGPISPYLGAGIQYGFFKEEWPAVPLETNGGRAGVFAAAGVRLRLARSLHLVTLMDYSFQPGGLGSRGKQVNLGGLSLTLGVRAGIL